MSKEFNVRHPRIMEVADSFDLNVSGVSRPDVICQISWGAIDQQVEAHRKLQAAALQLLAHGYRVGPQPNDDFAVFNVSLSGSPDAMEPEPTS